MKTKILDNKQEVAKDFSEYLKNLIGDEPFFVALSGGSTPKVVFDYLAAHHSDLHWSNVYFFWGDERCVPPTDSESNYKMTSDHLLSKIDIPAGNIHRIHGENMPEEEARRYGSLLQQKLPAENNTPQFDLVILGMGSDGHTASIFPHQRNLWFSENPCEVAEHPETGQKRITLTGKVINNAKKVAFLVTGKDKSEKVSEIFKHDEFSQRYPAALVSPRSGKLTWFLDEAAASSI